MDNALGMRRRQCCGCLLGERNHLGGSQSFAASFGQILLQRHAAQQFHHQVGPSILLPGVMDRTNIGMVQRGRGTRLAQKAIMGEVRARMGRSMPGRIVRARRACRRGGSTAQVRNQVAFRDQLEGDLAL